MAFTLSINVALGKSRTGKNLKAILVDQSGVAVGSAITTGFTEIGEGNSLWYYNSFPDGFTGGIKFLDADDDTLYAFTSLNDDTPASSTAVLVNQDYGGTGNLSYKTSGGAGISGATVRIYLTSDYDDGHTSNDFI